MTLHTKFENKFWRQGFKFVAGIDEVGRGALAGPVTAAAVIFSSKHQLIPGINDSKKLTSTKRQTLSKLILNQALFVSIGQSSVSDINQQGIVSATFSAMQKALSNLPSIDHALIDGSLKPPLSSLKPTQITTLIKGDSVSYSIAAASIVAKVHRDQLMTKLSKKFPQYFWDQNKGYGTLAHRQALLTHGPTTHHRTLFIRTTISPSPHQ